MDAAELSRATMATCIVCDRSFESAANDPHFDFVPYAGTLFYATGHYGSTVFDPMDSARLEIIVCDPCLRDREARVALILPHTAAAHRLRWDHRS